MKNQKYRQWCNRKALLAGVLAVSMAVTPMTTAFAGTGTQTAIALQDAKETSDEVVLADFDFNEAGDDGSFSGGNAIATVGGGSIELVKTRQNWKLQNSWHPTRTGCRCVQQTAAVC